VDRGLEIEEKTSASHSPRAPMATSGRAGPSLPTDSSSLPLLTAHCSPGTSPISISIYLADQNPGHDRSFGISRMSQTVISALKRGGGVEMRAVVSKTSQQPPPGSGTIRQLPWGTRRKTVRLLTDHLHPFFTQDHDLPDLYYFPKGYLPLCHWHSHPAVVTIHDTIIQYDADHYPEWRKHWEYSYWSWLLRHTLVHADRILTVSESSKQQIVSFMTRHHLPAKEITVTYEPCQYESTPQPIENGKGSHFLHLASREPHKRTAQLIRWWHHAEQQGRRLPTLHLVGSIPEEALPLLASSRSMVKRPFLDEDALQQAYHDAMALILPSEVEGFGLPALEAYYLGTPVCYVKGTSVEEILAPATSKGGFTLDDPATLFDAMDEVLAMSPEEVRQCGLKLRETYASDKVAERMFSVFRDAKN
jgi:glycosyltransferase involved in cell wall biosynthesis